MATLYELSQLCSAVYEANNRPPPGWAVLDTKSGSYGFKGTAYVGNGETVVAFRGTNITSADIGGSAGDVGADVMLGVGMNTSHFGQGEDFLAGLQAQGPITITGHSLGGAMAQIVGNRARLPFATFNAPGVAVFGANPITTSVRLGGSIASSMLHPVQAWNDVTSFFYRVTGVNVRIRSDVVSMIGVHYGKVITISGTSSIPQHSIDTVVSLLATGSPGNTTVQSHF
jgi:hypothetical protein